MDLRVCATALCLSQKRADLPCDGILTRISNHRYWGGLAHKKKPDYPLLLRGAVNASANIGNIIGQLSFGFMGDAFGRRFVYGKEMIIMIIGVILVISLPNSIEPTRNKMWYVFGFRILMGIGIGGDYPMSAAIVAERSSLRNRGRMLGWIFSNQGWVSHSSHSRQTIFKGERLTAYVNRVPSQAPSSHSFS